MPKMLLLCAVFVEMVPAAWEALKKIPEPLNGVHTPPPVHCVLSVHGVLLLVPAVHTLPNPLSEKQFSSTVSNCAPRAAFAFPKLVRVSPLRPFPSKRL